MTNSKSIKKQRSRRFRICPICGMRTARKNKIVIQNKELEECTFNCDVCILCSDGIIPTKYYTMLWTFFKPVI